MRNRITPGKLSPDGFVHTKNIRGKPTTGDMKWPFRSSIKYPRIILYGRCYSGEVVTSPGDMNYISVQYYVRYLCIYV